MEKKDSTRKFYRDYITSLIKKGAMKIALSWIAKKATWLTTGPLGWLTGLILDQLWDRFGEKTVKWALRKGTLFYDKTDGKIKAVKVIEARGTNDSSYDDAVDDILN